MNEKTNNNDPLGLIHALTAVKEYINSDSPKQAPYYEYQLLAACPLRTLMKALNDSDLTGNEYAELARFAVNGWQNKTIERTLQRTITEFSFLRQRTGISQQRLADEIGVSVTTVRRWEDPKNEYTPSLAAWNLLDRYEQWEKDKARESLENRIHDLNNEIDNTCKVLYGFQCDGQFPPNFPGIILLHYFRDEDSYQQAVNVINNQATPSNDDDPEESIAEPYDPDAIRHDRELWSVFTDAGSYTVHNAITTLIYEMVKNKDYDPSLTTLNLQVMFADDNEGNPAINMTVLLEEAWRNLPTRKVESSITSE